MNERGFVTFSFIYLLPLFMLAAFSVFFHLWFINQKHKLDNICYTHLLKAQQRLVDGNSALMAQNSLASGLILKKKALKIAIATGPPPVKVASRAALKLVVTQQKALKKVQTSIKHVASGLSRRDFVALQLNLKREFLNITRFWKAGPMVQPTMRPFWKDSQIEIAIKDIAPTYQRSQTHPEKQTLTMKWALSLNQVLPSWLKKFVTRSGRWTGGCKTHPHKGGTRWYAKIGEAKH